MLVMEQNEEISHTTQQNLQRYNQIHLIKSKDQNQIELVSSND